MKWLKLTKFIEIFFFEFFKTYKNRDKKWDYNNFYTNFTCTFTRIIYYFLWISNDIRN